MTRPKQVLLSKEVQGFRDHLTALDQRVHHSPHALIKMVGERLLREGLGVLEKTAEKKNIIPEKGAWTHAHQAIAAIQDFLVIERFDVIGESSKIGVVHTRLRDLGACGSREAR